MANTDGPCLPPGTGVKYSHTVEREHCHFISEELQLPGMHTACVGISGIFVQRVSREMSSR